MLILLSPSKTLDFSRRGVTGTPTMPIFLKEAEILVHELRQYSTPKLKKLMDISYKLAELNAERFQAFTTPFTPTNARQAIRAFQGDVYEGLSAANFTDADVAFAQQHLRIFSGLYGLLRPLDLMQPYRLEMGTKLKNPRGKDLYDFWGDSITSAINETKEETVINLASQEYFKALKPEKLKAKLLTITFKEKRGGKYQAIGLLAKKARGMMARFIITHRILIPDDIHNFQEGGYRYNASLSSKEEWVFTR